MTAVEARSTRLQGWLQRKREREMVCEDADGENKDPTTEKGNEETKERWIKIVTF